ncbi:virion protein [Human alphaherpesvirus 3]|uniref:ORF34 n=1 Tax=Human herpesvirus 3 TaxID=10335 RepID=Q6QCM1_HHV3|nr:virion protein [Human alphaherpesvirus 3]ABF21900.1 unknown [Human alphaherpesvirus 3]ABF21973.1 unknown [Human alphaherpesvirus 3]AKG57491.1 ORF34 [Human alphaherpesvirus 3]AKG57564.1 ORF34 [Human alphaherpesvirus 3]
MTARYGFGSISFPNKCGIFLSTTKNFIAPNFPIHYWTAPAFELRGRMNPDLEKNTLTLKNAAAVAALDNLRGETITLPTEIDRRLKPLEEQLTRMAKVLDSLETAAAEAEEADAQSEECTRTEIIRNESIHPEVQIAKNDAPLQYDTNFQVDFIALVYLGRARGNNSPGIVFGPWYRTLQERLVLDRPVAARGVDCKDGRISRTFMNTTVTCLQSAGRMYVGDRAYSAFECAVLCLYLMYRTSNSVHEPQVSSFGNLIEHLPEYTETFVNYMTTHENKNSYQFCYDRLPRDQFHARGGRYDQGALTSHSVMDALIRLQVLPPAPGQFNPGVNDIIDRNHTAYVDKIQQAAAAYLERAQNVFLMEDQTLLRLTIDTITALLLLRRLLWNGNVYGDKLKNNFQLGLIVSEATGTPTNNVILRGATGFDGKFKSGNNNFQFLCERYIAPLYTLNRTTELTEMFPGLVALCLDAHTQLSRGSLGRTVIDISSGQYQDRLISLIALELEHRRQNVTSLPIAAVVSIHDSVMLQYERGLGMLMHQPRVRAALEESRRLAQFNVNSDYDLLYFVCLGVIPQFASTP